MTKKEKIIKTALGLIVEQGIQATPMSQVSKESGIAIGTIYHHFKSKNEMVNEIYVFLKKELSLALSVAPENADDYEITFAQYWKIIYHFYCQNPQHFKFIQTFIYSPLITDKTREDSKQYYLPLIDFFQKGIKEGVIKPLDILLVSEMVYGNIVTLVQINLQKIITVNKKIINQAVAISWDSIKN